MTDQAEPPETSERRSLRDLFDTLAGRLFLLLVVGAVVSALLALVVSDTQHRRGLVQLHAFTVAERIADYDQALSGRPGVDTDETARRFALDIVDPGAPIGVEDPVLATAVADALRRRGVAGTTVQAHEAVPRVCDAAAASAIGGAPHLALARKAAKKKGPDGRPPPVPNCRVVTLTVSGVQTVSVAVGLPPRPQPLAVERLGVVFLLVLLAAAAGLAWIAAAMATAPLRRLSTAAGDLGRNLDRPPLKEEGSREVREAAAAFNIMQTRLKATMRDRTRMLAAITHDLQTPLTRLRLRIEKVADPELRQRLVSDLAATQALILEGLDLARAEDTPESWVRLDLDALIDALCEDAADAGQPVAFVERCGLIVQARPQALRRCLANLIDNAVKHGVNAEVRCQEFGGLARITVRDQGPGIPADRLTAVFEPFERLEASRSRDSGGTGLGLTIARRMAERTGADLTLRNHPDGGLEAIVGLRRGLDLDLSRSKDRPLTDDRRADAIR